MPHNESDIPRTEDESQRDQLNDQVITGEEIELPGEDSDASAIIGESSAPIHTGEIEAVAIGGLTGRVSGPAPLKPAIEDKISTGEIPAVSDTSAAFEALTPPSKDETTVEGGTPAEAPAPTPAEESSPVVASSSAESVPPVPTPAQAEAILAALTSESDEAPLAESAPATESASAAFEVVPPETSEALVTAESEPTESAVVIESEPEAVESATEADAHTEPVPPAPASAEPAHASYPFPSRRSMIFGDNEPAAPAAPIPTPASFSSTPTPEASAVSPDASEVEETRVEAAPPQPSPYAFDTPAHRDTLDDVTVTRVQRRSLLSEESDEADEATLASIAATAGRESGASTSERENSATSLEEALFSEASIVSEMPSRSGAHWLSFLGFLILTPLAWYLAADAGARMTLSEGAPMYTGVASFVALGELLGAVVCAIILFALARRSSLGAWVMGLVALAGGLPWVLLPGVFANALLAPLTSLSGAGAIGENLSHHLQASGYSGRFLMLGIFLLGVAYLSHSARRVGRSEEALRTQIEAHNPAGAFYSKRARRRAAKNAERS